MLWRVTTTTRVQLPVGLRLGTPDAADAFRRVKEAGSTLHNEEPISIGGGSPMFFFDDPFGNGLVYIQED